MVDFICVGPGRSGTSWLYEILREHPQICLAKDIKETQFYNDNYDRGMSWYESFFKHSSDHQIKGEISNLYFIHEEVPARIKKSNPSCKIIICLRNPYDRIKSIYSFRVREGAIRGSFSEALDTHSYIIDQCKMFRRISTYLNMFGKDNVFILEFDKLKSAPLNLVRDLFSFLDIDSEYLPTFLNKKVNVAIVPRARVFGSMAKLGALTLRTFGLYSVLTSLKRNEYVKHIFFKKFDNSSLILDEDMRCRLINEFQTDIDNTARLLGLDLSNWNI